VLALVRMHKDREHAETLADLRLVRFWTDFEYFVGVDKFLVTEKPIELVLLGKLVVVL
jgi:hypothetical protein